MGDIKKRKLRKMQVGVNVGLTVRHYSDNLNNQDNKAGSVTIMMKNVRCLMHT